MILETLSNNKCNFECCNYVRQQCQQQIAMFNFLFLFLEMSEKICYSFQIIRFFRPFEMVVNIMKMLKIKLKVVCTFRCFMWFWV